jgi:uncharacterized protein YbjT (DUF2867 family)
MNETQRSPVIAVLGASGLIGEALCRFLSDRGHDVVPMAREFTPTQRAAFADRLMTCPIVETDGQGLGLALAAARADIVVNCVGVLQDAPGSKASDTHQGFAGRLVHAVRGLRADPLILVHVSIPGRPEDDLTEFSRGKRAAEETIATSGLPYAILRPGFVVADAAYGGSALMRSLAVLPVDLPDDLARRPFAVTDVEDIGRTVAFLADEWKAGRREWRSTWDVMADGSSTVGDVLSGLSERLAGPTRRYRVPGWLLSAGSRMGDLVSRLGWKPPVRTTALAEMRRGVAGNPAAWRKATGIEPRPGAAVLRSVSATVQEGWFARMYLLKALTIGMLSVFWILSGAIAISVAFGDAVGILLAHGFDETLAKAITVGSSLMDISVGVLVANRRTCRLGLFAGIAVSLFYMVTAAFVTPEMWVEPLGALVKTGPAIVLMMVGLATLRDR